MRQNIINRQLVEVTKLMLEGERSQHKFNKMILDKLLELTAELEKMAEVLRDIQNVVEPYEFETKQIPKNE